MYMPHYVDGGDINQWLGRCWFWVTKDMLPKNTKFRDEEKPLERIPACFREGADTVRRRVACTSVYGTAMTVPLEAIQLHWPRCGAVQYNKIAVDVVRNVERQWRRSFYGSSVRVNIPMAWDVHSKTGIRSVRPDDPRLVEGLFFPRYIPYPQAVDLLKSKELVSVAVSPRVIIGGEKVLKMYYRGDLIATKEDNASEWCPLVDPSLVTRVTSQLLGGETPC